MTYETDAAKRYRDHAEELRVIAKCDGYTKTRDMLLGVAIDYERMAATLDAIHHSNGLMRKAAK